MKFFHRLFCFLGIHCTIPVWRGYGAYECKHCGIITAFIISCLLAGCAIPKPSTPIVTPSLKENVRLLQTAATQIDTSAKMIAADATSGETAAPGLPQWGTITAQAVQIQTLAAQIQTQGDEIAKLDAKVATLAASYKQELETNKQLREELKSGERKLLYWMFGIAAFAIAGGVALAVFVSPKIGIPVVLLGAILITVAKILLSWAWIVYAAGGALLLGFIIYAVYQHYVTHKRVLPQTTELLHKLKESLAPDVWERVMNATQDTDVQNFLDKIAGRVGLSHIFPI